jgi:hypothetical protein
MDDLFVSRDAPEDVVAPPIDSVIAFTIRRWDGQELAMHARGSLSMTALMLEVGGEFVRPLFSDGRRLSMTGNLYENGIHEGSLLHMFTGMTKPVLQPGGNPSEFHIVMNEWYKVENTRRNDTNKQVLFHISDAGSKTIWNVSCDNPFLLNDNGMKGVADSALASMGLTYPAGCVVALQGKVSLWRVREESPYIYERFTGMTISFKRTVEDIRGLCVQFTISSAPAGSVHFLPAAATADAVGTQSAAAADTNRPFIVKHTTLDDDDEDDELHLVLASSIMDV